jgi:hypothetical protein
VLYGLGWLVGWLVSWAVSWSVSQLVGRSVGQSVVQLAGHVVIYNLHQPRVNNSIVVCFLLGNSPASEVYMPTFRNTLSVPSS